MASESVANFQAVVMTLAAVAGAAIAGLGLWTWKQQNRWQQGRGLAVNLMQSFFELQMALNDTRRLSFSKIEDSLSDDEKSVAAQAAWQRAKDHDEKLNQAFRVFQRYVAEAIVVWNEDLSEIMTELIELKHIGSSLVLTGAATFDPNRKINERIASSTLFSAFHEDFWGTPDDRRGVAGRLAELETKLKVKINQRKLN